MRGRRAALEVRLRRLDVWDEKAEVSLGVRLRASLVFSCFHLHCWEWQRGVAQAGDWRRFLSGPSFLRLTPSLLQDFATLQAEPSSPVRCPVFACETMIAQLS
jgi:hypothetical protein